MINENKLIEEIEKISIKDSIEYMSCGCTVSQYEKDIGYIYKKIIDLIKNEEKVNEWIAIEEKFPEENEYVDITFIYKDDDDIDYDYYADVARYYCQMWLDGHGMPIIGNVIVWKPRPESYRKEKER